MLENLQIEMDIHKSCAMKQLTMEIQDSIFAIGMCIFRTAIAPAKGIHGLGLYREKSMLTKQTKKAAIG